MKWNKEDHNSYHIGKNTNYKTGRDRNRMLVPVKK